MFKGQSATAQPLPVTGEGHKIDVIIEPAGNTSVVALRQSSWVDGLGWCAQKTIRVDASQLEDLHRALTAARHRLAHERASSDAVGGPAATVIQFPTLL